MRKLNFTAALAQPKLQHAALFLVGMILRCWYIDRAPFWYDEGFSAILARLPFSAMLQATAGDVHPPLYYALLSLWAQLVGGYSPFLLRQLSAIFSILTLWQIDRLTARYNLGRISRLAVLGLAALSPMLIYYAQEARMYSLLIFLVLEIWLQILDRRYWLVTPLTVALLYTHNYGLLYAACLGLVALLRAFDRPRDRYTVGQPEFMGTDIPAVLLSFFVAAALYVPWLVYGLGGQLSTVGGDFWTRHTGALGNLLGTITMLTGPRISPPLAIALGSVVCACLPFIIIQVAKEKHLSWLIMALGPAALAALISLWRPIFLTRGLLAMLPAWYLLLVLMARRVILQPTALKIALLSVVVFGLVTGMGIHIGMTYMGLQKYNPLQFNAQIPVKPGVPVIHLGDFSMVNWMASRPDADNVLYLSPCEPLPGELSERTRTAMGMRLVAPGQLPAEYYLVPYVGNLSNLCHEQQYHTLTTGLDVLYMDTVQFGLSGVFYHGR